jgi:16S rRNA (uracil1498-N3)-methyltransferase
MSSTARLFIDSPLKQGNLIELPPEQAHYLSRILRLRVGSHVLLFNGIDGEWRSEIKGIHKNYCEVLLKQKSREQTQDPDLMLVFAPIKHVRQRFLIEKATELGVGALQIVNTDYTNVTRVNIERFKLNIREAAEQSNRLRIPKVYNSLSLPDLLSQWHLGRRLLVGDERGQGESVSVLKSLSLEDIQAPWGILIGPEGGLSKREFQLLAEKPYVSFVSLGPTILRSETAAIALISFWQVFYHDLVQQNKAKKIKELDY